MCVMCVLCVETLSLRLYVFCPVLDDENEMTSWWTKQRIKQLNKHICMC